MTKVINLYGGPGTGKSTNAARLFTLLKDSHKNAELVTEYVKQWAWENRKPVDYDQFYFFGKQARKEYSLFGKVDYIVTDSPTLLTSYYASVYGTEEQKSLFRDMSSTYYKMCSDKGVEHIHVFLKRDKLYNPAGRFQTEAEAKAIDEDLKKYLISMGVSFVEVVASEEGLLAFASKHLGR